MVGPFELARSSEPVCFFDMVGPFGLVGSFEPVGSFKPVH